MEENLYDIIGLTQEERKLKGEDFKKILKKKYKSLAMLDRIFEAECEGRNPTAAPRKMYTDAIKYRMQASDVGGVGRVTAKESETIKLG